jgi:hypothetical protein
MRSEGNAYWDGYRAAEGDAAQRIAELEAALVRRDALLRHVQDELGACMGHLAVEKLEACIKAELSK